MILGFAHLTRSTATPESVIADLAARGMALVAHHKGVPSASEKWPLLDRPAKSHELALLSGAPASGSPAIEVVAHDTGAVATPSRLELDAARSEIRLRVRDRGTVSRFFAEGLGFRDDGEGALSLESRFPQWRVTVRLSQDDAAPIDPPLDLEGWSCLAFYATNPESDATHLRSLGGRDATSVFPVSWTGSRMNIAMLRDPEGTIIELIKIVDRK